MTLTEFFTQNPKVALAFSGGVDSAYLLYAAVAAKADVKAYYVSSPFQPAFELADASRLASDIGAVMEVIPVDVLSEPSVAGNPRNRCYYCKNLIFSEIIRAAARDGYTTILDGTNASDDVADRPGMRALQEMKVLSPLRICGLTKDMIRSLSHEAGLFTWDKPAYACLATRIPCGQEITFHKLQITEQAETYLASVGFRDFRVRMDGTVAKLQLKEDQLPMLLQRRAEILSELKKYYTAVTLDLEVRT